MSHVVFISKSNCRYMNLTKIPVCFLNSGFEVERKSLASRVNAGWPRGALASFFCSGLISRGKWAQLDIKP